MPSPSVTMNESMDLMWLTVRLPLAQLLSETCEHGGVTSALPLDIPCTMLLSSTIVCNSHIYTVLKTQRAGNNIYLSLRAS
jgi:hypothetical protein